MSFIGEKTYGQTYAPGWFLADDEKCTRITKEVPDTGAHVTTNADGTKYAKMGTFVASLGGILYEDVDVSSGPMPGSVVVAGRYYSDRVIGTVSGIDALVDAGAYPKVTRPESEV